MTPRQREVARELIDKRGGGPLRGPFPTWLRNAELCDRVQRLGAHVRFDSCLPYLLRELSLMVTARHWDAPYPWAAHYDRAVAAGIPAAALAAISRREEPLFDAPDATAMYRLCRDILDDHYVSDEVFAEALGLFGEEGIVEAVAGVGYYSTLCMTLNSFQVDLAPEWSPPFEDVRHFQRIPAEVSNG